MTGLLGGFIPQFYGKISRQSLGKSFGFLFVFICIVSLLLAVRFSIAVFGMLPGLQSWAQDNLAQLAQEAPAMEMRNGELIAPRQSFLKVWEKERAAFAIEPDPARVQSVLDTHENVVVITQQEARVKARRAAGTSEIRTYDLSKTKLFKLEPIAQGVKLSLEDKSVELTPRLVKRWIRVISLFVLPVMILVFLLWFSFAKPIQLFFFSCVSLLANAILKAQRPYRELLNIGIYALVPPTALAVTLALVGLDRIPLFGLIFAAVYATYLVLGIKAASSEPGSAS